MQGLPLSAHRRVASSRMRLVFRAAILILFGVGGLAFAPPTRAVMPGSAMPVSRLQRPFGLAPHSMSVAQRAARPPRRRSRVSRETLIAKGLAGAALTRLAAASPSMAVLAAALLWLTILAPVMAVEALLLTLLLCVCGAASYWPANLFVFAIGAGGFGGYVQGALIWWETRVREAKIRQASKASGGRKMRRRDARRKAQETTSQEVETPEDGSAGLVALLAGTLTAAIVGALP